MQLAIKSKLEKLEQELGITVLYACETGSRAWGFASPDSDYDVRMIYANPQDWYISLKESKDTIELMLDDRNLDISGWDIRKTLRLLWKSNAPLFERLQSPIVYKSDLRFHERLSNLALNYYSPIATMHHYLSMTKKCFGDINKQDSFKLKTMFYATRTAAACKWILHKTEPPPIVFTQILDGLDLDARLVKRIMELIDLKSSKAESYTHQSEPMIFEFIDNTINNAEENANKLSASKGDIQELDWFLRETVKNMQT